METHFLGTKLLENSIANGFGSQKGLREEPQKAKKRASAPLPRKACVEKRLGGTVQPAGAQDKGRGAENSRLAVLPTEVNELQVQLCPRISGKSRLKVIFHSVDGTKRGRRAAGGEGGGRQGRGGRGVYSYHA